MLALLLPSFIVASGCGAEEEDEPAGGRAMPCVTPLPTPQPLPGLRLPTRPTREPCNGADDDLDGITDPHCENVPCSSTADCTYGGLVADADCNPWAALERGHAGCNQIDGVHAPGTFNDQCWGMLCPEGFKCVQGDCVVPESREPCSVCAHGSECPINAGCIQVDDDDQAGVCIQFCHAVPCPDGFECRVVRARVAGVTTRHDVCLADDRNFCGMPWGAEFELLVECR